MRKKIKEKMENILFFSRGGAALRRTDGFDRTRRLTARTNSTAVRRRAGFSKTYVWIRFLCLTRLRRRQICPKRTFWFIFSYAEGAQEV